MSSFILYCYFLLYISIIIIIIIILVIHQLWFNWWIGSYEPTCFKQLNVFPSQHDPCRKPPGQDGRYNVDRTMPNKKRGRCAQIYICNSLKRSHAIPNPRLVQFIVNGNNICNMFHRCTVCLATDSIYRGSYAYMFMNAHVLCS